MSHVYGLNCFQLRIMLQVLNAIKPQSCHMVFGFVWHVAPAHVLFCAWKFPLVLRGVALSQIESLFVAAFGCLEPEPFNLVLLVSARSSPCSSGLSDLLDLGEAHGNGYNTTLYLDAKEKRYIEEFSVCNFVGITKA